MRLHENWTESDWKWKKGIEYVSRSQMYSAYVIFSHTSWLDTLFVEKNLIFGFVQCCQLWILFGNIGIATYVEKKEKRILEKDASTPKIYVKMLL